MVVLLLAGLLSAFFWLGYWTSEVTSRALVVNDQDLPVMVLGIGRISQLLADPSFYTKAPVRHPRCEWYAFLRT